MTLAPDAAARLARRRALGFGALASLLAFIGRSAARAADALTIDANGNVMLAGALRIAGKNVLEFGVGAKHTVKVKKGDQETTEIVDKQGDAGKIVYQGWTEGALDIVGAGADVQSRQIKLWAEGGTTVWGPLNVARTVKAELLETNSGISLAAVQNAVTAAQNAVNILIPVGTIMAYGGDTRKNEVVGALKSQGWLPCDGGAYTAQDYPKLAEVIGNAFGAFRVPDLRGRFLRGTDQGQKRDPDSASRRAENGGNAGDNVGSVQDDQFKTHQHQYQAPTYVGPRNGNFSGDQWNPGAAQTELAGGNETRPKNVNVNWIIKAK